MNITRTFLHFAILFSLVIMAQIVRAEDTVQNSIEIRFVQHRFIPAKIEVHAGQPLTIRVVNSSKERIEFESFALDREMVVEPGKIVVLHFPALRAGKYDFYDDFHDDVPEGLIVAR